MTHTSKNLRKAAIVVSSLNATDAEALLKQMSAEQAVLVRQAAMELDNFSEAEERAVLSEFLGISIDDGVELDLSAAAYDGQFDDRSETGYAETGYAETGHAETGHAENRRAEAKALLEEIAAKTTPKEHRPFEFLSAAEPSSLVKFLHHEHPQTIALVLSHLRPDQAAEVVVQFASATQVDVLRRVAHLDQTSPEILNQVSREVEQQLRDRFLLLDTGSSGVATVQAIMNAAPSQDRQHLLNNVGKSDPHLAKRIQPVTDKQANPTRPAAPARANSARVPQQAGRPTRAERPKNTYPGHQPHTVAPQKRNEPTIEFPQLNNLAAREWQMLFQSVNRETLLVALAGADESLVNHVLKKLPYHQAESLRQSVNDIGPLRLSDVEFAQRRIVKAAIRLSQKGELKLPNPPRFAAAV